MKQIYLIPDRKKIEQALELRKQYDTGWEYNEFYLPEVLSDVKRQREIIDFYATVCNDFSNDTIHGAFLDVTPHSTDSLIREVSEQRIWESMAIAKEMGVRGVVFHTGRIYGFREAVYLDNWKRTNEALFRRVAERYPDIEIFMENMFDEAPDVLMDFGKSMADVENVGICLDYAHAFVFAEKTEEWLKLGAPYIRHVHINDNDGKNDLHLSVGDGVTDWNAFDAQMKEYHVKASVLIEVTGIEKQKKSLEYMRQNHIWPMK